MLDIAKRTILFKEADAEPVIVKVSEVAHFLTKGYVEHFKDARRLNLRRLKRKLAEIQRGVKELPDLKTCCDTRQIFENSTDRLKDLLMRRA